MGKEASWKADPVHHVNSANQEQVGQVQLLVSYCLWDVQPFLWQLCHHFCKRTTLHVEVHTPSRHSKCLIHPLQAAAVITHFANFSMFETN